jgi:hypothetical protein
MTFSYDVVEMALAHAVSPDTERRYKRSTLLEKRRALMAAWAKYCCGPAATGAVVPLRKADAHA